MMASSPDEVKVTIDPYKLSITVMEHCRGKHLYSHLKDIWVDMETFWDKALPFPLRTVDGLLFEVQGGWTIVNADMVDHEEDRRVLIDRLLRSEVGFHYPEKK